MPAEAAPDCGVYYCIVCGPVLLLMGGRRGTVAHQDIPHPDEVMFTDEESNPQ